MEQTLGSRDVGAPPLISTILWTCSGYSWAKKVQKDTLHNRGLVTDDVCSVFACVFCNTDILLTRKSVL